MTAQTQRQSAGDERDVPVVVLMVADLDRLHEVFDGRRLAVGRSIYLGLVRMAAKSGAEFTRGELANEAGVTKKTLDDYVPSFEAAGLLRVERRRDGSLNLPNRWVLTSVVSSERQVRECVYCGADPDTLDHVVAGGGNRGNLVPACRSCNSSKGARDVREWVEATDRDWPMIEQRLAGWGIRGVPTNSNDPQQSSSSLLDGEAEGGSGAPASLPPAPGDYEFPDGVPEDIAADANELLRRKTRVDGRQVTLGEMTVAAAAVAEFNRQSGSEFGLGAHLRPIVMRVRERPSYDFGAHVRLVQSAWRLKWWERRPGRRRGRPTLAVIYGHAGVFEQVVQDAVDEKSGRAQPEAPTGQFERTKGSVEDEEL